MTAVQLTACPAHGFFLRFSPTTQCPYCDQEQQAQQISSMMRMGVPSTLARASLGCYSVGDDEQALAARAIVNLYAKHFSLMLHDGANLLLWGRPGTGKTTLAAGALAHVALCGHTAHFMDASEKFKTGEQATTDLLVIDNVGYRGRAERHLAKVLSVRAAGGLPTILVSDLTSLDAIRGVLGVQASQALREHGCLAVCFGDVAKV